jgi:hypothetical protein
MGHSYTEKCLKPISMKGGEREKEREKGEEQGRVGS